jgi:hypothetical protein
MKSTGIGEAAMDLSVEVPEQGGKIVHPSSGAGEMANSRPWRATASERQKHNSDITRDAVDAAFATLAL